jgi:hypothetical protein
MAFMRAQLRDRLLSPAQVVKLTESLEVHALIRQGLATGGLRHVLLNFVK